MKDRMPPLVDSQMNDAQRTAAAALVAGPRKGVFGPFVPLMRSPELMDRIQRVGEYLRFQSSIPAALNEFAMCIVARHVTNHFEWTVHYGPAIKGGAPTAALDAIGSGSHPRGLPADHELVYDFVSEVLAHHGVSDATYARGVQRFGEQGVVDLVGLVGYFIAICLVMNVAHTPAPASDVRPMEHLPV